MKNLGSYQFILESTDSTGDDQSSESSCSLQGEPTVSAKDSSDISDFSSEFELATSPEVKPHPWSYDPNISSSGNSFHQVNDGMLIGSHLTDSDLSEASTIDSNYDTDDDIQVVRFPQCVMCSGVNENHFFQFCRSCYQIRKGFFPSKPKARKKKRAQNSFVSSALKEDTSSYYTKDCGQTIIAKNEKFSLMDKSLVSLASETVSSSTQDSGVESNHTLDWREDFRQEDKCLACLEKDTNALFLHGKTGHRCCCYQCAKRIWFETGRCPICRSKVNNIIKILNS